MAPPVSEDMRRRMLVWYHEQHKTAPPIHTELQVVNRGHHQNPKKAAPEFRLPDAEEVIEVDDSDSDSDDNDDDLDEGVTRVSLQAIMFCE
ncbi:hypothetical protein BYT27DRAFT_7257465 [Phlegmacium glaucopus]|nr:hypothetical protein BYT27DRAFT_7257465 [Phlegmacium glaucopus]